MEDNSKVTALEIPELSPVASWAWKTIMFVAQLITAAAKEDISNEQKKELVSQEVMEFLDNFNIPLPYFVLKELVGFTIDKIYGVLKDQLNFFSKEGDNH